MDQSFSKKEKLKSRKIITRVFEEGHSLKKFPLKLIYLRLNSEENSVNNRGRSPRGIEEKHKLMSGQIPEHLNLDYRVKTGVSVPKKLVKTAVARNRIKRLMREAFRKNKYLVINELSGSYALMFIYISREETELKKLESQMQKLLRELVEKEKPRN